MLIFLYLAKEMYSFLQGLTNFLLPCAPEAFVARVRVREVPHEPRLRFQKEIKMKYSRHAGTSHFRDL